MKKYVNRILFKCLENLLLKWVFGKLFLYFFMSENFFGHTTFRKTWSAQSKISCPVMNNLPRSLGQGNIFSTMCQDFCSHEGSASVHAGIPPPRPGTPPRSRHHTLYPPEQTSPPETRHAPPAQCMLGDTVNKRAVCILLECNLVMNFNSVNY